MTLNYAAALFDLAWEEGVCCEVDRQLEVLRECFSAQPVFGKLLSAPNISTEERLEILDSSFRGAVHPYVLNFLKLLTEKGYAHCFEDCCKAYRSIFYKRQGILPVTVESAQILTAAHKERLMEILGSHTGKKIVLENRVDPTCLGGLRISYDGKQVDGTVKGRMRALAENLKYSFMVGG